MKQQQPRRTTPPAKPAPVEAPAPPWVRIATLAAAALLLIACFSPSFDGHDAWWQLKTGQYIVQNHKLPLPDPFAFTTYIGAPSYPGEAAVRDFNLTHEWLAQVFMYLAYAAGGFPLVVLLRALLLAGACALTGSVAWRRTANLYLAIGASLAAAAVSYNFAYDRPAIVTYVFVAVAIAAIEYRRWLWALPLLFLVWANCHGAFFLGWAVLGAYCLDAVFRREKVARQLCTVTAISVALSYVNPNGFSVFSTMLKYRASYMQSMLAEWHRASLWPPSPFSVVLIAAAALLFYARRKVRLVDWLLFLGFAAFAIYAIRNIVFLAIVGPVMIAAYFPWKLPPLPVKWQKALPALLLVAIALPVSAKRAFQWYANEAIRPAGAANFLLRHHVTGPMFNTYEQGGYLMWRLAPRMKVFVDGRALNEAAFRDYRRITYGLVKPGEKTVFQLLDQYGVQTILLNGYEYVSGSPHYVILMLARNDSPWKLVYQDGEGMVWMRQPPAGVQPLPNIAALSSMEAQCAAHIQLVPTEPLCARETVKMFEYLGKWDRARSWMAYYLDHKTSADPGAEAEYQKLTRQ